MDQSNFQCLHAFVSGRVQGVFYRQSTRNKALELGLYGFVRNLEDGRVEVLACGEQAVLRELEKWLWQGPPRAKVEQVVSEWQDPIKGQKSGFVIR